MEMTIVHICLCCFYVEGMGYQENILPKIHSSWGNQVYVLTSDFAFNAKGEKVKKERKQYINEFGVEVRVLDRNTKNVFYRKFGKFTGLQEQLNAIKPDIIFVHGGAFLSLKEIIGYCKKNKAVKLFIDQHADYYNSPVNTLKAKLITGGMYGHYMRSAAKYCSKFWGVTPWRCEYLHKIYGVPENKIDLLVMGGDDEKIHFEQMPELRTKIRRQLNLDESDFVLITGGKIDRTKNIHLLMQAVKELDNDKIKLIVFGQPNDDMQQEIETLAADKHIRYIGWIEAEKAYDYFLACDLGFFPGTHSVLWEQACACGLPCVFKDWQGMRHVDVGGNCVMLENDSGDEIRKVINDIYDNTENYAGMKEAAQRGIKVFSYEEIAKKAIGLNE